ncbi:MAG: hypothetical protein HY866_03135 [Chloroflexi bacterium]|nr:hypothetical protein [Chloroflexota bacterium]
MPVELQWHASLPVLMATYRGTLSAKDYEKMCDERLKMLRNGPDQVVFVADTRDLLAFADAEAAARRESIFLHEKIVHTLLILQEDVYHRLVRSFMNDASTPYPVSFATDIDQALVELKGILS